MRSALSAFCVALAFSSWAESASIAPKFLLTAAEKTDAKVVCDAGVTCAPEGGRHVMTVAPGEAAWPTVSLLPVNGTWDLSPWGHLEVELQNPGKEPLSVGLRIDNPGDWKANPWNAENVYLKPGEKKVGKVIFGYSYGFQKAFKLDPSKVSGVKIFLNGKKPVERKLVIGDVMAAGGSGEKPAVDPSRIVVKPAEGRLFPLTLLWMPDEAKLNAPAAPMTSTRIGGRVPVGVLRCGGDPAYVSVSFGE